MTVTVSGEGALPWVHTEQVVFPWNDKLTVLNTATFTEGGQSFYRVEALYKLGPVLPTTSLDVRIKVREQVTLFRSFEESKSDSNV